MPKFAIDDYVVSVCPQRPLPMPGHGYSGQRLSSLNTAGHIISVHTGQIEEQEERPMLFEGCEDFEDYDTGYTIRTDKGDVYECDQIYLERATHPLERLQRSLDL